jgi:hypothetical protein
MASPIKHPTDKATKNGRIICPWAFDNAGRKTIALNTVRRMEILDAIDP